MFRKEGYPTIAFQCVVDHTRRILYVSDAFFGGTRDKTIAAKVSFPVRVAAGQYKDQEHILYDVNGVPMMCRGVYLIVDGRFEKLGHYIFPKPIRSETLYEMDQVRIRSEIINQD